MAGLVAADEHVPSVGKKLDTIKDVGNRHRHDLNPGIARPDSDLERHPSNHRAGARWEPDVNERARRPSSK